MRADLHDELDRRLHADGARWRAATVLQDESVLRPGHLAPLDEVRAGRSRRFRSRLAIAASVAAVLAIALGVLLSRTSPNDPPARPAGLAHPPVGLGTGYGQVSPGTHACDASEFRLLTVSHRTAQGAVIITVSLEDIADSECSMPGHGPLARLLDPRGDLLTEGADATASALLPRVIKPGTQVDVSARWFSTCHLRAPAAQLQLRLQGPPYEKGARQFGTYVTVSLHDVPAPGCSAQEQGDPENVDGMVVPVR
jgi:hypothetical protein